MKNYRWIAIRNASFTAVQVPVRILIGLFLPPVILAHVGVEGYGIWSLILVFSSFLTLADFGTHQALTKLIAELQANRQIGKINALLTASALLYGSVGLLIAAAIFLSRRFIFAYFFKITQTGHFSLDTLLLWSLLVNFLVLLANLLHSIMNGFQRMDLASRIQIFGLTANAFTQILGLHNGLGLYALPLGFTVSVLIQFLFGFRYVSRMVPGFHFTTSEIFSSVRRLVRLSLGEIAVRLSGTIAGNIDKLLISSIVGVHWVAYYDLAFRLLNQIRMLPASVLQMMVPLASELQALARRKQLVALYSEGMKYLCLIAIPLFGFVCTFAYEIVRVWLGKDLTMVAFTLQIVSVANFLNLLTGPAYFLSLGMGQVRVGVRFSVALLILCCTVNPLFAVLFRYHGVLFGYALSTSLSSILIMILFAQENRFPAVKDALYTISKPALIALPMLLGLLVLYQVTEGFHLGASWISLTAVSAIFVVFLIFALKSFRLIGPQEATLLNNLLSHLSDWRSAPSVES